MPRILIVDDQRIPRVTVAATLEEVGHEIAAEANGPAGIEKARSWSPDVIVLDVYMPEMDGFAVVERLKEDPETASIPVIFLTAEPPTDELVVRGLNLGAYDFLSKSCSKAELLARVGVMSRIKRSNDELSAVARIADSLIQTLDPEQLSTLFVEQTKEIFRADAALLRIAGSEGHARLQASVGMDARDPLLEPTATALGGLLGERRVDAEIFSPEELKGPAGVLMRREGFESVIAVCLAHAERPPTFCAIFTRRTNGFRRESDAPLLHLLARQASIALDNAVLHSRAREQAQTLRRQAEELEKAMSERSRFFASMSHELRTPINAVIGYNQLLQTGAYGDLTGKQQDATNKVHRSANHLLELINDILDISKIEAGKVQISHAPTDLSALLEDTVTSVRLQAIQKGLTLVVDTPEDLVVETDAARVRQILLNLLSNAVKFTDEGEVRAQILTVAGEVEIRVSDTGPGIPPVDRERIFEEFEQVEATLNREGTGLGLAISRKLALLLGGELELESEVGVGSTFTLRLPGPTGEGPVARSPDAGNGEARSR